MRKSVLSNRIPIKGKPNEYVEVELYYSKGNYDRPRGFYLSTQPIKVEGIFTSFMGFSGYYKCILKVERYSKAGEKIALEKMGEHLPDMLLRTRLRNNIELEGE